MIFLSKPNYLTLSLNVISKSQLSMYGFVCTPIFVLYDRLNKIFANNNLLRRGSFDTNKNYFESQNLQPLFYE